MTGTRSTERRARLEALDALRGTAALAVVMYHFLSRGPELYPELGTRAEWVQFGQYGVHLFFVISGFVIFMTLQRATVRSFAVSRFIRLYPIYWVCIALTSTVVAIWGLPGREVSPLETLINLTMLQQYLGVPAVDGAYWTLAAELGFYVQVGILFFLGMLSPNRITPVLYAWIVAATAMSQAYKYAPAGQGLLEAVAPAFVWIPLFVAGIAFHLIWQGERRIAILVLPLVALAAMALRGPTVGLATAGVTVVFALALWFMPTRMGSGLTGLGGISYALYLIHQNVGYVIMRETTGAGAHPTVAAAVALVAVIVLAACLTRLVDEPLRSALSKALLPARRQVGARSQTTPR